MFYERENVRSTPTPPTSIPSYSLRFLRYGQHKDFKCQGHYSKVRGHIEITPWTFYTLWFPRYGPDKILTLKVTMTRSKVESRSQYDFAHFQ